MSRDEPLKFFYEACGDAEGEFRWWRNDALPDVFDVINRVELASRLTAAAMCLIEVVDHLPAFCDDDGCEHCRDYK